MPFTRFSKLALVAAIALPKSNGSDGDTCDCPKRCPSNELSIRTARCYAQLPIEGIHESFLETDSSGSTRHLSEDDQGFVVHYQFDTTTTGHIPKNEVVASVNSALNGGNNFEVQYTSTTQDTRQTYVLVRDLTRDGMRLSEESGALSGAFSIVNAFVVDEPGVFFRVDCPDDSVENNNCRVTQVDADGKTLVNCWQDESDLVVHNIPDTCLDKHYDIALGATEAGVHFFLYATSHDADLTNQDICPLNVVFDSWGGKKKKAVVFQNDINRVVEHNMGSASLGKILQAEEEVEPISTLSYDVETRNCVNYAQDIWRQLELSETHELAQFIFGHVQKNANIGMLKQRVREKGALRALAAFKLGGYGNLFAQLEKTIYSQLDIKVDMDDAPCPARGM